LIEINFDRGEATSTDFICPKSSASLNLSASEDEAFDLTAHDASEAREFYELMITHA
jgi:hypothetical protein